MGALKALAVVVFLAVVVGDGSFDIGSVRGDLENKYRCPKVIFGLFLFLQGWCRIERGRVCGCVMCLGVSNTERRAAGDKSICASESSPRHPFLLLRRCSAAQGQSGVFPSLHCM